MVRTFFFTLKHCTYFFRWGVIRYKHKQVLLKHNPNNR
jgi:hypothetical protein